MSSLPITIPIRPAPGPVHSFRQVYIINGEPYIFVCERWREGEAPAGVPVTVSLLPGHVLTGRLIRSNTGETFMPFSSWIEVFQPVAAV